MPARVGRSPAGKAACPADSVPECTNPHKNLYRVARQSPHARASGQCRRSDAGGRAKCTSRAVEPAVFARQHDVTSGAVSCPVMARVARIVLTLLAIAALGLLLPLAPRGLASHPHPASSYAEAVERVDS